MRKYKRVMNGGRNILKIIVQNIFWGRELLCGEKKESVRIKMNHVRMLCVTSEIKNCAFPRISKLKHVNDKDITELNL